MGNTAAQNLVQALADLGAKKAFCVPGESYLSVLDAFHDHQNDIELITCRHESGASNMAEAYGKLTGEPGLCFVTRAPGATNASIGLHTGMQDSTPMILFIGQVAANQKDREAFQEVDYSHMFGQMAKWVAQIDEPDRIGEYVARAWATATSGRPGPVVLALPEDMLSELSSSPAVKPHKTIRANPSADDVADVVKALAGAERPLVMIGGSGWSAEGVAALASFAEKNNLPVACTFRRQGLLDNRHPNYVGDVGIAPNPKLAKRVKEADVILALGPRLGEMTTGDYTLIAPDPKQKLLHVHAGAEELGRVYQADVRINAGSSEMALALAEHSLLQSDTRATWCVEAKADYDAWIMPVTNAGDVQLSEIYAHLRETLPRDAILTNGAGNYAGWLHRFYQYGGMGTQLAPTSGAMGYGVPAAIGAKITQPERTVLCAAGDGCFLMTGQELATAKRYNAGVIFMVFNNSMYGTIRMHQEKNFPTRISATELTNPDFVAFAESFGVKGHKAETTEQFKQAMATALKHDGPSLIEVIVDPEAITSTTTLSTIRENALKS